MNILPVVPTLKAIKEVTDLLGTSPLKVWEDIAPSGTAYPYAVWSVVTANPENNLDCPANTDHVSFQIVVYDTQQKRASDIRAAIRKALEPYWCKRFSCSANSSYQCCGSTNWTLILVI